MELDKAKLVLCGLKTHWSQIISTFNRLCRHYIVRAIWDQGQLLTARSYFGKMSNLQSAVY